MSLFTQIQIIVEGLYPDATFMLASAFEGNYESLNIDPADLPLIILDDMLSKDCEVKQSNNVQKDTTILINCFNQGSPENTTLERNTIYDAMEDIADVIGVNVYQLAEVIPLANQRYKITLQRRIGCLLLMRSDRLLRGGYIGHKWDLRSEMA